MMNELRCVLLTACLLCPTLVRGQSSEGVAVSSWKIVIVDPPEKDFFSKVLDYHGIPNGVQREVRARFDEQHKRSLAKGLWQKSYAGSNPDEFFAELTMWYFGTHGDLHMTGPKPEDGPEGLRKYDPEAYALMDDFYGGRIEITKAEPRRRGRRAEADRPDSPQPAPGSAATTNNAPPVTASPHESHQP